MSKVEIKYYNKKPYQLLNNRKDYEKFSLLIEKVKTMFSIYIKTTVNTCPKIIVRDLKYYLLSWLEELGLQKYIDDFEIVLMPPPFPPSFDDTEDIRVSLKFVENV